MKCTTNSKKKKCRQFGGTLQKKNSVEVEQSELLKKKASPSKNRHQTRKAGQSQPAGIY